MRFSNCASPDPQHRVPTNQVTETDSHRFLFWTFRIKACYSTPLYIETQSSRWCSCFENKYILCLWTDVSFTEASVCFGERNQKRTDAPCNPGARSDASGEPIVMGQLKKGLYRRHTVRDSFRKYGNPEVPLVFKGKPWNQYNLDLHVTVQFEFTPAVFLLTWNYEMWVCTWCKQSTFICRWYSTNLSVNTST